MTINSQSRLAYAALNGRVGDKRITIGPVAKQHCDRKGQDGL